jgi:hypothetical protein
MADWGLFAWVEGGRLPGPTLLAYELFEMLRVDAEDDWRDDRTEDAEDVSRRVPVRAVARTYAFAGLKLGGTGASLACSPARSARVLRFNVLPGGCIAVERALVADADISNSFPGVGI